MQNRYFDYLIDQSFQGVNRHFVLSFQNRTDRTIHKIYYIPKVELKDYVIIEEKSFFDQPIKNYLKTCDNIRKIAAGQGDDHTTGCLLDYPCFKGF